MEAGRTSRLKKVSTGYLSFGPLEAEIVVTIHQAPLFRIGKIQRFRLGQHSLTIFLITALRIPNAPDSSIRLIIMKGGEEKIGMSSSAYIELALKGQKMVLREENTKERSIFKKRPIN